MVIFNCPIYVFVFCLMFLQASLQPGGTITFEHRNLQGLNRSLTGSVTTSNFLNPQVL